MYYKSISAKGVPLGKMVLPCAVCLLVIGPLLFAMGMSRHLDHDEHQFVAPAALLARRGLLPYRDYPYFHVPNLVFLNAGIFRFTDHLLLGARLVSVCCGIATLAILFCLTFGLLAHHGRRVAWIGAFAAIATLCGSQNFATTTGRAWNHDFPLLMTMLALLAVWRGLRAEGRRRPILIAVSGILFGAAAGTRLTYAPAGAAFVLTILGGSVVEKRKRIFELVIFCSGAGLALIPTIWLFIISPDAFLFGNFRYPMLNTAIRRLDGLPGAITFGGKLEYVFTNVLSHPANAVIFGAGAASLLALRRRSEHPFRLEIFSTLLLILTLLIGTFAPSPLFAPYFFAPLPFGILFVVLAISDPRPGMNGAARWFKPLGIGALVALLFGIPEYREITRALRTSTWIPVQSHELGVEIAQATGGGRVLTLAPTIPLEGGCDVYEQYATGPFALRVGELLDQEEETEFKMVDVDDLPEMLRDRAPRAVLLGRERHLDDVLERYATQQRFFLIEGGARRETLGGWRLWVDSGAKVRGGANGTAQMQTTASRLGRRSFCSTFKQFHFWRRRLLFGFKMR